MRRTVLCIAVVLITACAHDSTQHTAASVPLENWPVYGHDEGGTRFSPLADINRDNVSKLSIAWVAHTGETVAVFECCVGFESTPNRFDGTLYFTTGTNRIIALDAENGATRWEYDPEIDVTADYGDGLINRVLYPSDSGLSDRAVPPPGIRGHRRTPYRR